MHNLKWTLRVSRKARYARLQIKPFGGLEVVIPPRFPRHQIPSLVEQHADWATRQLDRQERLRQAVQLPGEIRLAFDNSVTPVVYPDRPGTTTDLFTGLQESLHIEGKDQSHCLKQLRQWIRRRAQDLFPPTVERISRRTGLGFKKLSIRSQKTRWGSCSSKGSISLNDQLLFVPPDCAEYLIIHELCHTRHMNHSPNFWQLVEHHCPDYRRHENYLGQSRSWVPDWYLLDLYR